jgi:hypothetical protein
VPHRVLVNRSMGTVTVTLRHAVYAAEVSAAVLSASYASSMATFSLANSGGIRAAGQLLPGVGRAYVLVLRRKNGVVHAAAVHTSAVTSATRPRLRGARQGVRLCIRLGHSD